MFHLFYWIYKELRTKDTAFSNEGHYHSTTILTMEPTMEPLPITAFIDCSPLGLYCRDCMVAFSSNETARNHLKSNHQESINTMKPGAVRETFKELRARSGVKSCLEEWLIGEPKAVAIVIFFIWNFFIYKYSFILNYSSESIFIKGYVQLWVNQ